MDMLSRYLHAVEFWLPKEQRRDIIAELSEDIRSQIEDRENSLGRALTEDELAALLCDRGSPILVANRFLPQRSLIGPMLFPIYLFALKMQAVVAIIPILTTVVRMVELPASRWGALWLQALGSLVSLAFTAVGAMTLMFALLEWSGLPTRLQSRWDPRKMPLPHNPNVIRRSSAFFEIGTNLAVLLWWLGEAASPGFLGIELVVEPGWWIFFWGFAATLWASIAIAAANLARPVWTVRRALVRLGVDAVGCALVCWMFKANIVTGLIIGGQAVASEHTISTALDQAFPGVLLVSLGILAGNLWRVVRAARPLSSVPGTPASQIG